ncbi:4Fe-4S dicluster domain-containing protein, partial [Aduncisulcus paluster]
IIGKDIYRQLGDKVDGTTVRMPWSDSMREMLKALYSPAEAELIVRMPYRPSSLERISKLTGMDERSLRPMLESMCHKGLPFCNRFFEFTMMRTKGELDSAKWAELFSNYMFGDKSFFEANFGNDEQISIMRALPHEGTIRNVDHVEVLDYEKASAMVAQQDRFAVSLCSCRHEKMHLGEQKCGIDLETCTSMGEAADFLIRNNFAREISRSEMDDIMARSREMGFTLTTDNVRE